MLHDAEIDFAITSGQAWKEFFRQWRREPEFSWPPDLPFSDQHLMLVNAARNYGLPECPFSESARQRAMQEARTEAAEIFAASPGELDEIMPPTEIMLP